MATAAWPPLPWRSAPHSTSTSLPNQASSVPSYFPTIDGYSARISRAGFQIDYIALIPRPTPLPTGMRGWLETFAIPFTNVLPEMDRGEFLDEVTERLRPALCDEQGRWTADYMRLRFLARAVATRIV